MLTLRQKQSKFAKMAGEFLVWIFSHPGWAVTFGETVRINPAFKKTLHGLRLAMDLNFFINGVYQRDTAAYLPLGEKWEEMGGTWGGRFNEQDGMPGTDGNHFSLMHEGVR